MMYKIVPMTTENVTNQITCFKVEGLHDAPIVPQGVLPNATLYQVCLYVYCKVLCLCVNSTAGTDDSGVSCVDVSF